MNPYLRLVLIIVLGVIGYVFAGKYNAANKEYLMEVQTTAAMIGRSGLDSSMQKRLFSEETRDAALQTLHKREPALAIHIQISFRDVELKKLKCTDATFGTGVTIMLIMGLLVSLAIDRSKEEKEQVEVAAAKTPAIP